MPTEHEQDGSSMKTRLQRSGQQTAMLVKRAERVMREPRKLREQREMQLRQMEQVLQSAAHTCDEIRGQIGTAAKVG
jgi:hypothetical protein